MCPVCMETMALMVAGAVSTGETVMLVVKKLFSCEKPSPLGGRAGPKPPTS